MMSARIELKIAVRGVTPTSQSYDLAVVGAGICGLAHALAAARRGKRVVVIDRDAQANGASIRNFGFITVTGQQAGDCWRRAKRSVEVWLAIRTGRPKDLEVQRSAIPLPYYIGLIAGAPDADNGKKLIEFLLSKEAQAAVSSVALGLPVREDVTPTDVNFAKLHDAMQGVTIWTPDWRSPARTPICRGLQSSMSRTTKAKR